VQLVEMVPRRWRELGHEMAKFHTIAVFSLNRVLPKRLQGIGHELAKFGTIGLINLLVNFAVFNLLWLTFLRNGEVKAKIVATVVATTCAYFMNRHWTYRDRPKSTLRREYSLFFLFNAVGLVIEAAVVGMAKYGFDQTHIAVLNLCSAIGIVLGTIFRFWAYRTHVFKLDTAPQVEQPAVRTVVAEAAVTEPSDDALRDELTQIELDTIVASEQTATHTNS
jgi:putative flippase GtrA